MKLAHNQCRFNYWLLRVAPIQGCLAVLMPTQCNTGPSHLNNCFRDKVRSVLMCKPVSHRGFHKSGVPIVNAELPNPSSCFIVPLSMGQSLRSRPFQSVHCSRDSIKRQRGFNFLFVLMWPTWPQFAHLRCVPALFMSTFAGDDGEAGSSSAPSRWTPFCLSRAIRRSLLRCSRASSFSSLNSNQHLGFCDHEH